MFGSKRGSDRKEEAKTQRTGGRESGSNDKDQYVSRMTSDLDKWEMEIGELVKKVRPATARAIEEHQERIKKLEQNIAKGRSKIKEIIGSTDDAWHTLRVGADAISHDIRNNLNAARKAYHDELLDD
jgi:predicted  nucleic acid-binding Zn-ribbon protein